MKISLLFGYHAIHEVLLHRPQSVRLVLIADSRAGKRRQEIENLCRQHGVGIRVVSEAELTRRVGTGHNGFAAEVPELHAGEGRSDAGLVVLVEDVQDPRNLGALLRVCEGAGVGRVLIRDRGSAPLSPTVVKTSAGATEWLAVERVVNSARALEELKRQGYWVYGADAAGVPPWQVELTGKVVLCLGGEEKGLRMRTRNICDALVGLPMYGRVSSLNLATAASALLYEAVRQREALPADGKSR